MLDSEGALDIIALSLQSPSPKTKALVLEILGAVCLIPGGHQCVLEGMDKLCAQAKTRFRFEMVVYTLWQACQGMTPHDKDLQVQCRVPPPMLCVAIPNPEYRALSL